MNTNDIKVIESVKAETRRLSTTRPTEYQVSRHLDREGAYGWVAKSRDQFKAQIIAEKKALYETLDAYHTKRLAEFRKEIAFAMTRQELTRIVADMVVHDQVMATKSGRSEYCNTFNELEKAIISAENRINFKPKTVATDDLLEKARQILQKKGVIRMESMDSNKMEKVKFAFNLKSFAEISNEGYKMVVMA